MSPSVRAAILAAFTVSISSCQERRTLSEEFPGDWGSPSQAVISTLAHNGVRGCGEFYQKRYFDGSDEYIVACTRDGNVWTVWRVWTGSKQVLGPDPAAIIGLGGAPDRSKITGPPIGAH